MGGRIDEGMPRMANERLPERSIPDRSPGHAFISDRSSRLGPAHQGMKTRSCDLVWRVGTADSATPHSDPSGGQAPALHFLVPPSIIGLQFGTFRPGRAGIEVDWRGHFRTNDENGWRGSIPERRPGHAFVRMTRWVAGMTRVGIYSRTNDAHETGPLKSKQVRFSPTLDFGEPNLLP